VYRFNFLLWRFRNVITLLIKYYLWTAVYGSHSMLFGYSQTHMLTYIMLSTVISSFVLATRTADVAGEILQGKIIDYVLRPLDFFTYQITRDVADKLINISLQVIEIAIVIALVKPVLFVQTNPQALLLTFVFLVLGTIIAFFVNLLIAFLGFWTHEVWAPRFVFTMLVLVFSGSYFPLDIIPRNVYVLFFLTPFPYLYFIPTRAYLGMPPQDIAFTLLGAVGWSFLSFYLARKVWQKGLREFSFFGR